MLWSEVSANWSAYQRSVKARWPGVDLDTIAGIDGDRAALNAHLGKALGLTPREADEQIDEWLRAPLPLDPASSVRDIAALSESRAEIPGGANDMAAPARGRTGALADN